MLSILLDVIAAELRGYGFCKRKSLLLQLFWRKFGGKEHENVEIPVPRDPCVACNRARNHSLCNAASVNRVREFPAETEYLRSLAVAGAYGFQHFRLVFIEPLRHFRSQLSLCRCIWGL